MTNTPCYTYAQEGRNFVSGHMHAGTHEYHLRRWSHLPIELNTEDKIGLFITEKAIDYGDLFHDELFRHELSMKGCGYNSVHSKQTARQGLVNLIPHCSDSNDFFHFKCVYCNFETKTLQARSLFNPRICVSSQVLSLHRQFHSWCPLLVGDVTVKNIPYINIKNELNVFERNEYIRFPIETQIEDRETNADPLLCAVCKSNRRNVLFLNCNHCALCVECTLTAIRPGPDHLIRCIICNQNIAGYCQVNFVLDNDRQAIRQEWGELVARLEEEEYGC
jgi:Zinc finger, C3HC4 type (RING finger)